MIIKLGVQLPQTRYHTFQMSYVYRNNF